MRRTLWALGAALPAALVAAGSLGAQDLELHPRSPVMFLEKSYFFPLAPYRRSLLFEGQAAGHYFIVNRLHWAWTHDGGWAYTVPVSMVSDVRMSDATSEPVRTPSYRIGIRPQFLYAWPEDADPGTVKVFGVSGGFMHYSNGQAGCTYLGYARPRPDAECAVSDPALAAERRANTLDGDFSTSYFSLALHGLRGRHHGYRGPMRIQHLASLELQLHPLNIRPGGMNREQALGYGQHVLQGSYELERRLFLARPGRGLARLGFRGGYRFPYSGGEDGRFLTTEVSYAFDCLQKFGFVLRWHLGNDYYNINFQDTRPLVAFGMMWDPGRIDAFNRIARGKPAGPSTPVYRCKGD